MALQSSFGFSNTTASTHDITPKVLGVTTNYSVVTDDADETVLSNKTAPVDQEEIISYRSRVLQRVDTDLNNQYPSPVKGGIQYQVVLQDMLSTTDSANAAFRVDEPIVAQLTIRHPRSGNITNSHIATVVTRLISACLRSDGTWRFDDLMRSAERPIVD